MATAAERLVEAEAALHALLTGKQVVSVRDMSGDSVTYSMTNRQALVVYIRDLKAEIAGTVGMTHRGPIRPVFG